MRAFLFTLSASVLFYRKGEVTQLVRVPPCQGGGCEFKSRLSHFLVFSRPAANTHLCPDDGMVDVTDLGSVFWQFKSASGYFLDLTDFSARLVKW